MSGADDRVALSPESIARTGLRDPGGGKKATTPAPTDEDRQHGTGTCRANPGTCLLTPRQRQNAEQNFVARALAAESNCKLALSKIEMAELLRKEEDASWLALLVLDVITAHLASSFVRGFETFRAAKVEDLEQLASGLANKGARLSFTSHAAQTVLSTANETGARAVVKTIGDVAKKRISTAMKVAAGGKQTNLDYIATLQDAIGVDFERLREDLPVEVSDSELLAATASLSEQTHGVGAYLAAFTDKLARFKASQVASIGRTFANHETTTDYGAMSSRAVRDTRVVWLVSGGRIELRYQTVDMRRSELRVPNGMGFHGTADELVWGDGDQIGNADELGPMVPVEFIQVAIARHEAMWGQPPPTVKTTNFGTWFDQDANGKWDMTETPSPKQPAPRQPNIPKGPVHVH